MKRVIVSFCLLLMSLLIGCDRGADAKSVSKVDISDELIDKANAGDPEAQFELGKKQIAQELSKSKKSGFSWICRAATNGLPKAQCYLGACFYKGIFVGEDSLNVYHAKEWLGKAEKKNDAIACRILGFIECEDGYWKDGIKHLKKAADLDDAIAQCYLGRIGLYGDPIGTEIDYDALDVDAAYGYFKAATISGNQLAKYEYTSMNILLERFDEAKKLLSSGFDQSNPRYMKLQSDYFLAKANSNRNEKVGVDWLKKAAATGLPSALRDLGICNLYGLYGCLTNESEAVSLLEKAAAKLDCEAMNTLGLLYYNGNAGLNKDMRRSINYFEDAGRRGYSSAQANLSQIYMDGLGVKADYKIGLKWARRAAVNGNAIGEFVMGFNYAKGRGVRQDDNEAVKWFKKSKKHGNANADAWLKMYKEKGIKVE